MHLLQAFFMSAYLVVPLKYWYPCTPVAVR
nr:MAG TPA: hypothetical protein [Caudoviricetes sp.]DAV72944.1 MAG TPA: hypothetical protein [Caudoviricetes sp.]